METHLWVRDIYPSKRHLWCLSGEHYQVKSSFSSFEERFFFHGLSEVGSGYLCWGLKNQLSSLQEDIPDLLPKPAAYLHWSIYFCSISSWLLSFFIPNLPLTWNYETFHRTGHVCLVSLTLQATVPGPQDRLGGKWRLTWWLAFLVEMCNSLWSSCLKSKGDESQLSTIPLYSELPHACQFYVRPIHLHVHSFRMESREAMEILRNLRKRTKPR